MRPFAKHFRINGMPVLAPDADVSVVYADLASSDGGRDEAGAMHRIVLRPMLGKWTFFYSQLSEEEKRYMERLFPDGQDFQFTHPDRLRAGQEVTSLAYREDCAMSWHNATAGLWRNYKFQIVEC